MIREGFVVFPYPRTQVLPLVRCFHFHGKKARVSVSISMEISMDSGFPWNLEEMDGIPWNLFHITGLDKRTDWTPNLYGDIL